MELMRKRATKVVVNWKRYDISWKWESYSTLIEVKNEVHLNFGFNLQLQKITK